MKKGQAKECYPTVEGAEVSVVMEVEVGRGEVVAVRAEEGGVPGEKAVVPGEIDRHHHHRRTKGEGWHR